jgi:GDP-L-fucose synthase
LMDISRLTQAGWKAKVSLREGIERTLDWYSANYQPTLSPH